MDKSIVRLVTCGSVDDGKSTLIGRLLVETDSVPSDTIESAKSTRRAGSTIQKGEIDFSLLTDGLEAEREQGITIDVAYRSMNLLNGKRLIIADAPGHEQYTRNMVVAASRADIALVLVDGTRGIRPQTLRHLTICSLLGVSKICIVINKLDKLGFDERVFNDIAYKLSSTTQKLQLKNVSFIPVSALLGDNVAQNSFNFPWYKGPTLLEFLEKLPEELVSKNSPRINIQWVTRAEEFRGVSGTVIGGNFSLGDQVAVSGTKKTAIISKIITFDSELTQTFPGSAVTLVLEPEIDTSRGDILELSGSETSPANRFAANLVWFDDESLITSKSYILMCGPIEIPVLVTNIKYKLNIASGEHEAATTLSINEIGFVEIATDSPVSLIPYSEDRFNGGFILIDRVSMNTVGAGMIAHSLRRSENIVEQQYEIDRIARSVQKNQSPKIFWFTGLSGSGKSTIANAFEKSLYALGKHVYVLDGDNMRLGLNKDLGFTREDRAENVRRIAEVAHTLYEAGLITVVALVSPYSEDRNQAKSMFPANDFYEIWIRTPKDVCESRDPKGLYQKAKSGKLPNLTGIGQEYQPPENPDLILDGIDSIENNVNKLIDRFFNMD